MAAMRGAQAVTGKSLVRLLTTTYAFLVVLILVAGLSGGFALTVSLRAADRVISDVTPTRAAGQVVRLDLAEMQSGVRGYLLTGNTAFLDHAVDDRARWHADRGRLVGLADRAGEDPLVDRDIALADDWVRDYVDPVLATVGDPVALAGVRRTRDSDLARSEFDTFRNTAQTLDRHLRADAADLQARASSVRRTARLVLLGVVAASVLLGLVAAGTTARVVVLPLSRLRRTVEAMTAGDIDRRADETVGLSEVRAVAGALNALAGERTRARAADADRAAARRGAHDVGLRIRERIDVVGVEQTALEELGQTFGVDRVLMRRVDDGRLEPVHRQWHEVDLEPLDEETLDRLRPLGTAVQAEALWAEVVQLAGTLSDDGTEAEDTEVADLLRLTGARACLVAAFGAGRETLGTLTLLHQRNPHRWSDAEMTAVESIAADLGRALQHARIYDRERALVDQLRELDRTKTDFLSTVSHELRTPLTSITGYVELLREDTAGLDAGTTKMLDVIERNSYRLNALIEDLLVLSRIESGSVHAQQVPVDIDSLVRNACADICPRAVESGLLLDVLAGPDGAQVTGDPGQLDRVLLNLLSNAVKFTPPGGRVTAGWQVADGHVVMVVEDTGIGIPSGEQDQLSSRFFRASNAMAAAIPGTGLGLSIVRGILDLHGGSLQISSSVGGTRVEIRLPARPGVALAGGPSREGTRGRSDRL